MDFIKGLITHISPIFLVSSPVTSYADQIYSIHRTRSCSGFSLDIPLIMLVASITKVYYWFSIHYDNALLIQACIMILVQIILLHVALSNRAAPDASKQLNAPFTGVQDPGYGFGRRPYDFWQWKSARPYWIFLCYFAAVLLLLQSLIGDVNLYANTIGYVALAIEATLPVPQILSNQQNRSCKGFRLSVLVNWLIGDVMKMSFFFLADTTIPWAFKLCGLFQFACDIYLGVQYWQFGDGQPGTTGWAPGKG